MPQPGHTLTLHRSESRSRLLLLVFSETNFNLLVASLPVIDGYQTVNGNRVLLAGQTDLVENGIYIADGTLPWERSADMADGSNGKGRML
jgi:hypothetical protein